MTKQDFKGMLKELGMSYGDFCEIHHLSRRTLYEWVSPPLWAEYWVRMRVAERKLGEIRGLVE